MSRTVAVINQGLRSLFNSDLLLPIKKALTRTDTIPSLHNRLIGLNVKKGPIPDMSPETKRFLVKKYLDDFEKFLQDKIGKDNLEERRKETKTKIERLFQAVIRKATGRTLRPTPREFLAHFEAKARGREHHAK